ncbi:MAG: FecR family protein [Thermodesulfobacteriota bacterium]
MGKTIVWLILFMVFLATPLWGGENAAGSIKNLQGAVLVERQGKSIPAEKGMRIYARDIIVTGADGSVGVILQDNTIFSLGPDSRLALQEYVFAPDEGRFALLAKMIKGTFVYLSGVIAKLSPESVKLETPVGTIAIRGTRFAAKIAENR